MNFHVSQSLSFAHQDQLPSPGPSREAGSPKYIWEHGLEGGRQGGCQHTQRILSGECRDPRPLVQPPLRRSRWALDAQSDRRKRQSWRPGQVLCKDSKCSPLSECVPQAGRQAACPEEPPATRACEQRQPGQGKESSRGGCSLGAGPASLQHDPGFPPALGAACACLCLSHSSSSHSGLALNDTGFCGRSKKINSQ